MYEWYDTFQVTIFLYKSGKHYFLQVNKKKKSKSRHFKYNII